MGLLHAVATAIARAVATAASEVACLRQQAQPASSLASAFSPCPRRHHHHWHTQGLESTWQWEGMAISQVYQVSLGCGQSLGGLGKECPPPGPSSPSLCRYDTFLFPHKKNTFSQQSIFYPLFLNEDGRIRGKRHSKLHYRFRRYSTLSSFA